MVLKGNFCGFPVEHIGCICLWTADSFHLAQISLELQHIDRVFRVLHCYLSDIVFGFQLELETVTFVHPDRAQVQLQESRWINFLTQRFRISSHIRTNSKLDSSNSFPVTGRADSQLINMIEQSV